MDVTRIDFPEAELYVLKSGDWRGFRSHACAKEPETVEWIRSFEPDSVFWDVGASVGPYTLIAASLGHKVVAFEPFLPSAGELQQNVWINELGHLVDVHPTMLGSSRGYREFKARSFEPGSSIHGTGPFPQSVFMEQASDLTLRWTESPDHIKIDVDGGELDVIEGLGPVVPKSIMVESTPRVIEDIAVVLSASGLTLQDSWKRMGDTKERNYLFKGEE